MEEMLCVTCIHSKVCSFKEKLIDLYMAVANIEKDTIFTVSVDCTEYRKDTGTLRERDKCI